MQAIVLTTPIIKISKELIEEGKCVFINERSELFTNENLAIHAGCPYRKIEAAELLEKPKKPNKGTPLKDTATAVSQESSSNTEKTINIPPKNL